MDKSQGNQQSQQSQPSQADKRKDQDRSGTSKPQPGGRTDKSSQQNRDREGQQGSDRSSSSIYRSPEAESDDDE